MSDKLTPPFRVLETEGGHFKVLDANDVGVAWCYTADDKGYQGSGDVRMTKDQARQMAHQIARLPELVK